MADILSLLEMLEKDETYKKWRKNHKTSYLCHCLKMMNEEEGWHMGFYNENDTITSFLVGKDFVEIADESEIFKEPGAKVKPLSVEDIKFDDDKALEIARGVLSKNYPKEVVLKSVIIIQNIDIGQVYNVTFITMAMNTVNIKIDTKTKKELEHKITSLMDFRAKEELK
jgi:hypothetical protein